MAVLSVPNLGIEMLEFMRPMWAVRDNFRDCFGCLCCNL